MGKTCCPFCATAYTPKNAQEHFRSMCMMAQDEASRRTNSKAQTPCAIVSLAPGRSTRRGSLGREGSVFPACYLVGTAPQAQRAIRLGRTGRRRSLIVTVEKDQVAEPCADDDDGRSQSPPPLVTTNTPGGNKVLLAALSSEPKRRPFHSLRKFFSAKFGRSAS